MMRPPLRRGPLSALGLWKTLWKCCGNPVEKFVFSIDCHFFLCYSWTYQGLLRQSTAPLPGAWMMHAVILCPRQLAPGSPATA